MDRTSPQPLEACTVAFLVADGTEHVEVTAPRDALQDAGARVLLFSPTGEAVLGYHYLSPVGDLRVDGPLTDLNPDDIDALVLPGGLGGPDTLRQDEHVVDIVSACVAAGTPIGVICHGPWMLLEASALSDRTLTCVPALKTDVTNGGAKYQDAPVCVDDSSRPLLVSGRNFEVAEQFGEALVEALAA